MEKTYYFPIFYLRIQEDNYLTSNAEFEKLEELLQPDGYHNQSGISLLRTRLSSMAPRQTGPLVGGRF